MNRRMKKILTLQPILVGLICAGMFNLLALAVRAQSLAGLGNLPLYFEAGPAPANGPARFITRGCNYQFSLLPAEVQITLGKNGVKPAEVRMDFAGSNPGAQMAGDSELPGKVNYLLGNDPAAWRTGVPTFARVRVEQLYPGVNLVYYGNQRQLEYDFTLAPGADPDMIKIHFAGVDKISIGGQGELILALGRDEIRQPAPVIYQTVAGIRQAVDGGYRVINRNTVAFAIGKYDHQLPLVIDPVLSFSTYFGGNSSDNAWSIALDTNGFIYIAGQTLSKQMSATNPAPFSTTGAFQTNYQGGSQVGDAFIAKFDGSGTNLIYLTYLGGSSDDAAYGLAVDNAGDAYVAGATESANFPIRNGIYTNIGGPFNSHVGLYAADAFVAELNPSGSNLVYSTYLGGESADAAFGIALDAANNAYVTGFSYSTNFPTTPNAFQNHLACINTIYFNANAFVTEIGAGGTNLIYSSYLGGTNFDQGESIAVDISNNVYVTGFSASTNFPTTNFIFQQLIQTNFSGTNQVIITNFFNGSLLNGSSNLTSADDVFVAKFAPSCTNLDYSTFLGGTNNDVANHIAVDGAGNAYVTGWTVSTNFPDTVTGITNLYNGLSNNAAFVSPLITNAFLTQITWSGSNAAIGYSAVFGGTNFGGDVGYGVTLDPSGNVYVVGASTSTNFPAINTPGLLGTTNAGGSDVFVIVFTSNAAGVLYSGYLGGSGNDYGYGIAVDSQTNVYITGLTASANFPTYFPYQSSLQGPSDAFLAKISWSVQPPVITTQPTNQAVAVGSVVAMVTTVTGTPPFSFQWQVQGTNLTWTNLVNGGNISGATNTTLTINPAQTTNSGNYQLIVTNYGGSVTSLVANLTVTNGPPVITVQPTNQLVETGQSAFLVSAAAGSPSLGYQWQAQETNLTWTNVLNGGNISGATGSTLTFSGAQTNNSGNYQVVVTNYVGSVTSAVAVLTITSAPFLTVQPTNQTVGVGSTVTFFVNGYATPPFSLQWVENGIILVDGGNISGSTNNLLTITNAQTYNDGNYWIVVTNNYGSVTSSVATLTVLTAPLFGGITAGTNGGFILSGVGGTNSGNYVVLTSTNLATPVALWTPVATNQFGSQGQFIFTNTPSTNTSQQFYLLQMP
jgi:hypothetical protein